VAARSKAYVYGRLVAGIAGLNPPWGMDVCLLCLYVVLSCVGKGLCDGLITSMRLRNLKGGSQGQNWAVEPLDGWMGGILCIF
jgi:hypothetical protein